jgi:adenylate cyclase
MSYSHRYILIAWFIFLPFSIKALSLQSRTLANEEPALKYILVNNDTLRIHDGSQIVLNHNQNNLTFALQPDSVFYQFFLEGFDREWSTWRSVSFREYTNLPAGMYKFRIKYIIGGSSGGETSLIIIKILKPWYFSGIALIFYAISVLLTLWFLYNFLNLKFARKLYTLEQIINKRTEDLIIEKEKTEELLANVLPRNTATEIMEKGKATKIKYNFVTVLFSDIQGFTRIAEETNPEILIDELDKFFFYFDSVVEKHRIEKIKTIGDAYMCAGGIPEKNRTNPVEVILAALEMKAYMKMLRETSEFEGMKFWDIRIGIHTGTVVAGVVGQKKLSYDIWGDTVNTASRMESSGEAGKINISGTTYEFVKEFFECEYRGKMPVKYKGELEMYFVNGIVPELRNEDGSPNSIFTIRMQKIKLQDVEEMILKTFDDEAPPNLYFHNSLMVRNISNQVELLSGAENLPEEDYINLKLASVFLLTGYISDYEKPMEASIRMVKEILPQYGYTQENVESAGNLISNSFAERYDTLSDFILHDARYDYLGRVDYLKLTDKLLRESAEYGMQMDREAWVKSQLQLLEHHEFLTKTARLLRNIPSDAQTSALQATLNNPNS